MYISLALAERKKNQLMHVKYIYLQFFLTKCTNSELDELLSDIGCVCVVRFTWSHLSIWLEFIGAESLHVNSHKKNLLEICVDFTEFCCNRNYFSIHDEPENNEQRHKKKTVTHAIENGRMKWQQCYCKFLSVHFSHTIQLNITIRCCFLWFCIILLLCIHFQFSIASHFHHRCYSICFFFRFISTKQNEATVKMTRTTTITTKKNIEPKPKPKQ